MPRLEPWPTISSGTTSPAAQRTASSTSSAVAGASVLTPLESRNVRKGERAAMHVHAAELGTAAQLRKNLARVEQVLRIECAFDPHLLVEIDLAEHLRHQIALFDADAMLAGEHPADRHAEPQDIGAEGLRLVQLSRPVGIVEDQRMEIAVAGVEHIGDPQPVARGELAHAGQHPRQLLAGNGAVHAVV